MSHNPMGLHGLLHGKIYLFYLLQVYMEEYSINNLYKVRSSNHLTYGEM
jgi:hypothetical protein